jgi:hypothetical protein
MKMAKKQLTEFTMHCQCGAVAPIFKLKNGRFMGHCPDCGALVFFSNPVLLERLRFLEGLIAEVMIIAYEPETPWWCPRCGQELADAMIAEKGATSPDIFVYACPKCHFFVVPWGDAPKGIAVDSLHFEAKK